MNFNHLPISPQNSQNFFLLLTVNVDVHICYLYGIGGGNSDHSGQFLAQVCIIEKKTKTDSKLAWTCPYLGEKKKQPMHL